MLEPLYLVACHSCHKYSTVRNPSRLGLAVMKRKVLAVDPGNPPTFVMRTYETNTGRTTELRFAEEHAIATQLFHKTKAGNQASSFKMNPVAMGDLIYSWEPDLVIVERVTIRPQEALASGVEFVGGMFVVAGICAGIKIDLVAPTPSVWKRDMNLPGKLKPNANEIIRRAAINAFPVYAGMFKRVKDHNRADAALLALWEEKYGANMQRGL